MTDQRIYGVAPSLVIGRNRAYEEASDPSHSYVADMSFFSRRTQSSSGSSYPSLLFPRHRSYEESNLFDDLTRQSSVEDSLLLEDLPKHRSFQDSLLVYNIQQRKDDCDKSSVAGDTGGGVDDDDGTSGERSQASSFSFSKLWGACGITDPAPLSKEVLHWMQEQVEQLIERRRRRSNRKTSHKYGTTRMQHEWGKKPSVDELSAYSDSSDSLSDQTEGTGRTSSTKNIFVDTSASTSWEATDNEWATDDEELSSLPNPRYLPGPMHRKTAPHSHRESTRYEF